MQSVVEKVGGGDVGCDAFGAGSDVVSAVASPAALSVLVALFVPVELLVAVPVPSAGHCAGSVITPVAVLEAVAVLAPASAASNLLPVLASAVASGLSVAVALADSTTPADAVSSPVAALVPVELLVAVPPPTTDARCDPLVTHIDGEAPVDAKTLRAVAAGTKTQPCSVHVEQVPCARHGSLGQVPSEANISPVEALLATSAVALAVASLLLLRVWHSPL